MTKYLFAFSLVLSVHAANLYAMHDTTTLRQRTEAIFARFPQARFAIAYKDLDTKKMFLRNADDVFHAASTMKTPVMIEVYKQAAKGRFTLSDSVPVKNTFSSIVDGSPYTLDSTDDSEHDLYLHIGKKLPLSNLVFRMITVSSNLATNIIIELVGAKNVTQTMRELGAKKIEVLRGVEDDKAFQKGWSNTTTAYDLMVIMEQIASGKAVDQRSSAGMLDILMHQQFKRVIGGQLPSNVKVANKTGAFKGTRHDSGIVFLPDGRKYVIVLLSTGIDDDEQSAAALAEVSRVVYEEMVGSK